MKASKDAFGEMLMAIHHGQDAFEIVERNDGYIGVGVGRRYFDEFARWLPHERRAMRYVRGRVLDVGCGAGRWQLELEARRHHVVGIDTSRLAVKVCRERGAKDVRLQSITQVSRELGEFDTILMMGNNFGLFGNEQRAKWLLRRFKNLTSDSGRIVAASSDPLETDNPVHRAYHRNNRKLGRMPGQTRIRVRYSIHRSDWFDYLLASQQDAMNLLRGTGWHIDKIVDVGTPHYAMVLEKG